MFLYKQFYVRALVGVLIKSLYEMHGATINKKNELDGVCGMDGGEERCALGLGWETLGKETSWKALA